MVHPDHLFVQCHRLRLRGRGEGAELRRCSELGSAVAPLDRSQLYSGLLRLLDLLPQHLLRRHRAKRLAHREDRHCQVCCFSVVVVFVGVGVNVVVAVVVAFDVAVVVAIAVVVVAGVDIVVAVVAAGDIFVAAVVVGGCVVVAAVVVISFSRFYP